MKWIDVNDIVIELSEVYFDQDLLKINFVDLCNWVMVLFDFNDDLKYSGEKVFEVIQQVWIDEVL